MKVAVVPLCHLGCSAVAGFCPSRLRRESRNRVEGFEEAVQVVLRVRVDRVAVVLMECWNNDLLNDENEEEETQENKVRMALCRIACKSILIYYEKYICKELCRTVKRTGNIFIQEILHGNETRCYENFRLRKSVLLDLSKDLTDKYGLKPTRGMSVYEEFGMFLMICVHGAGNRLVQDIFQHSGETIHRNFHSVIKAIGKLARDIIRPHQVIMMVQKIASHDCIGALDGTHVKARFPQGQEIPYIGHKGYPTQNILAVVDFNMCFTFAWAGWEGAAHDNHIFGEALRRPELNFHILQGTNIILLMQDIHT
uniref:Uncharacterized protein LOC104214910 n=1 Tax=Nicotiana sylvestris TaxID=4096 RepID=A0A1U7VM63_NICSY|nr:PREDICTED: uncharacterized protein LOC104214910 [Nicotiana sylvestris]